MKITCSLSSVVTVAACGCALAGCNPKGPLYRIDVERNAAVYERTAAAELERYLPQVVTNAFTVGGKSGVVLHVGDTSFARAHGIGAGDLRDEEWRVKSFGADVILVGGGTRGTIYAVSHFLEDQCGIHWWSEQEDHVPPAKELHFPALDAGGVPYFLERDVFVGCASKVVGSNLTRIAVLNRMNGMKSERPDYGGSFTWGPPGGVHTFDYYIPWKKLGAVHPEWFSLVSGMRKGGITRGQLCLEAPGLADEMYRKLLEYIRKGDEDADMKGLPRPHLYDLSMNDCSVPCQCEKCKAAEKKHGWSGQLVRFLNGIAEKIAKRRPDILITTLAYHYTERPPKDDTRAADNLVIRLCDTRSSMAGSILDENNQGLLRNLKGWSKCAKNIFIWDYAICYSFGKDLPNAVSFPVASERHYSDLYRTFRDCGVKGVFVEQECNHVGDFDALKYFLQAKLMEDPDANAEALTRLFMKCYYGAAERYMYDYRVDLDRLRRERNGFVTWEPGIAPYNFIENEDVVRYQAMFDRAEKAVADDPLRLMRVQHARAGLDTLVIRRAGVRVVYHGPEPAQPDVSASLARVRRYWPEWIARYGSRWAVGSPSDRNVMSVTNDIPTEALERLPAPPEFRNRRFYDFYPWDMTGGTLVDDAESPSGKARMLVADVDPNNHYGLPFIVGFHNLTGIGINGVKGLSKPAGKGYHWYKFQTGVMPPSEWVYMTRAWSFSLRKGLSRLAGKTLETWVSLKFEGPRYFPKDPSENGKESVIRLGRLIFAEPE